ncbi:BCCT family transporter (plasmid) [Pseudovibrio brasiliensis]|uniref:BCCT family transporter n=2 Tax=Pseudovibrio brasiliensis TaxID=1898042 RepID=A0ABX8AV99_9HYPH|nr:BCCT family transporter [Pseudovibrio brasiliensis]
MGASMAKLQLDKTNFFVGGIAVLLPTMGILAADIAAPGSGKAFISSLKSYLTNEFGAFYMWAAILSLIFCLAVSFSKYGNIVLGEADEKPEYSTISWVAMIFSAGIGAGILWGGASEWIYYMSTPPLGLEPGTELAKEWAITTGMFHWGPSAWALYSVCSITIGYYYYVRKDPVLKVSESCKGVLGTRAKGPLGNVVDIFIMIGLVTASATSLGLGTPVVAAGISKVLGLEHGTAMNLAALAIVVGLFTISSALGLKKGMAKLSNFNIFLAVGLLVFVLFFGGYFLTTIKSFTTSVGSLATNFVRLSTYMEPYAENSTFVSDWTIFYWAWWVSYGPFQGLFFAKISRGRTIREMVLGTLLFGSLGTAVFFAIFGNYGIGLLDAGIFDAPAALASGQTSFTVIIDMFANLPLGTLFIIGLCVSAVVFMATTFDAASFSLAAMTTKELPDGADPALWNRLVWALFLGIIPIVINLIGGDLGTIQISTVVGGLLMVVILGIVALSFIKELKSDIANGVELPMRKK